MQAQRRSFSLRTWTAKLRGRLTGRWRINHFHVAVAHDWGKSQHPDFSIARTADLLRRLGYVLCRKIACIPIWDV